MVDLPQPGDLYGHAPKCLSWGNLILIYLNLTSGHDFTGLGPRFLSLGPKGCEGIQWVPVDSGVELLILFKWGYLLGKQAGPWQKWYVIVISRVSCQNNNQFIVRYILRNII